LYARGNLFSAKTKRDRARGTKTTVIIKKLYHVINAGFFTFFNRY